jgi:acetyl esterase/lipase
VLKFAVRLLLAGAMVAAIFETSLLRADEPKKELLWPEGAPGAKGEEEKDKPGVTIYLPPADKANGTGIVVCPGGGYGHLAMGHEGVEIAEWLNSLGITAFVLDYRHAGKGYQHPAPSQDAQRAIRFVRTHAEKWKLDPNRIGIMGFSAGGHLASTVGTHFDQGDSEAKDPVDRASSRPDFMILCYPVISLTEYTHRNSVKNLLGQNPDQALLDNLSNEKQVTAETPPTFLFHTSADRVVAPENSVLFYLALRKAKVPAELHVYQEGSHGAGLAMKDEVLTTWKDRLADWLKTRGLLEKK